jgi:hypothetical protein
MKKLDRKQMQQVAVLGILFLAAIGYAAYQLFFAGTTGASTKSPSATATEQQAKNVEPQTTAPAWLNTSEPARDPFVVPPQFDNLRQNRVQTSRQRSLYWETYRYWATCLSRPTPNAAARRLWSS